MGKLYKMELLRIFIDEFDRFKACLCIFEDYGDFWLKSLDEDFNYEFNDDVMPIALGTEAPYEDKVWACDRGICSTL